jgi:hypothetical protein
MQPDVEYGCDRFRAYGRGSITLRLQAHGVTDDRGQYQYVAVPMRNVAQLLRLMSSLGLGLAVLSW